MDQRFLATIVFVILTTSAAAQNPTAPPTPRTGMIVGQVVDQSGQPVSEAIVMLNLPATAETIRSTVNPRVMADREGRFFFADLPAGRYGVQATKDGYAPGWNGQRQPWASSTSPVILADGERRTDLVVRVWKYAVISGTVVDEAGEPVVGIAVRALPKTVFAGRVRYGNSEVIPELVPHAITDDRGMFRFTQLSPGTFVVLVPSTHATVPVTNLVNLETTVRNELFRAGVSEIAPPGSPRTLSMGDFALMTLNRVLIPPPPAPDGRMQVYKTTFYPSAMTAGTATPITIKAGEERSDLTIALRPAPAATISGRLVSPDGSPVPPMTIRLVGESMTDVISTRFSNPGQVGLDAATGLSDAGGRFMLIGVPPGEYVLEQANPIPNAAVRSGRPAYSLSQPVVVGRQDVRDLVVPLRGALQIGGRVEYRNDSGATPPPTRQFALVVFETPYGEPGQVAAEGERDSPTFSVAAAPGQFIARTVDFGGWFLRSVTLDGRDITERAFDLQADTKSIVITYTDRPSKVSGTVTDARGTPSATAVVLLFPVDRERWSGFGSNPRMLRTALAARDGAYTFPHVLPGEYYVVAVEPGDSDGWQDPVRLDALANLASRLSIGAEDSAKTLDLRVRSAQ